MHTKGDVESRGETLSPSVTEEVILYMRVTLKTKL